MRIGGLKDESEGRVIEFSSPRSWVRHKAFLGRLAQFMIYEREREESLD